MSTRPKTVSPPTLTAECHSCPWATYAPNGLGNAARHHDATGHPITITIHRTITYGNPNTPPPGQTTILDELTDTAA